MNVIDAQTRGMDILFRGVKGLASEELSSESGTLLTLNAPKSLALG